MWGPVRGRLGDNIVHTERRVNVVTLSSSTKHVACVLLRIKMFTLRVHIAYNLSPVATSFLCFALLCQTGVRLFATNIYTMGIKGLWTVSFVLYWCARGY
jgi:hypothetical protein